MDNKNIVPSSLPNGRNSTSNMNNNNCNSLDEEDQTILNADLLVTRSSERRRVLFYSNRSDLPYNLKILMKYNQHIEELAADDYFNRMVQFKNDYRDLLTPSEAEITAAEKHRAFHNAVDSLCMVSNKLNSSLLDELEELKRGNLGTPSKVTAAGESDDVVVVETFPQ
jgi:hypothetical protein